MSAVIADGLEPRQCSITVSGRRRSVAALRGIAGPIVDVKPARDAAVQRALAHLENRRCLRILLAKGMPDDLAPAMR
ncbi:hypothetical protein [Nocardia sp. NBC_01388]|uniref:hypothetical protein n=1 Tax=Nocardia sp. NBC_01388 TaxID=2903596 RepID=UPI0032462B0C